jgi:hypothetical protein
VEISKCQFDDPWNAGALPPGALWFIVTHELPLTVYDMIVQQNNNVWKDIGNPLPVVVHSFMT